MVDAPLSPYSIQVRHGYMKAVFSWAVRAGYLSASPVRGLTLLEYSRTSSGQMLSAGEALELLALFEDTPYWLPVFLGLHTGCGQAKSLASLGMM